MIAFQEACKAKEEGEAALAKAKQLEGEQMQRLQSVQSQLQALRDKEKSIAQVCSWFQKNKHKMT